MGSVVKPYPRPSLPTCSASPRCIRSGSHRPRSTAWSCCTVHAKRRWPNASCRGPRLRHSHCCSTHRIDVVVDVRFRPRSQRNPAFNDAALARRLGARYVADGKRLGNAAFFGPRPRNALLWSTTPSSVRATGSASRSCARSRSRRTASSRHRRELAEHAFAIEHLQVATTLDRPRAADAFLMAPELPTGFASKGKARGFSTLA